MSVLEHRYGIRDDVVALTFDDGPSPWTGPILDLLAAHEGHATFFTLGCLASASGGASRSATFVIEKLQRGSIVCMHDGRPPDEPAELSAPTREASVAAVGMILDAMSQRGLRSVTISELLLSS
jgi:peptidoglycan/xylan/chitin deacetylase (PgdA/CDA1 family)